MADVAELVTIGSAQITAAVTGTALTAVTLGNGLAGVSGWIRFAGTGGSTVDAYIQQTPDGGTTWVDVYCAHFTAAGVALFSLVQGAGANLASTDGSLANNTALNSGAVPLFDQFRLKYTSTGIWVAGTLAAYAMPRG
jgi:hypothetical protein